MFILNTMKSYVFVSNLQNRDVQALLPLTVKQINNAFLSSDDKSNFVIDGVDVNNVSYRTCMFCLFLVVELLVELHYVQVKLIGMVRNRAGRITDVTFALDDGTGRIDCSKWFVLPSSKMEKKLTIVDIDSF